VNIGATIGSTVVEHSIHYPTIAGSNPAVRALGKERMRGGSFVNILISLDQKKSLKTLIKISQQFSTQKAFKFQTHFTSVLTEKN
jgi:hypothetical protein